MDPGNVVVSHTQIVSVVPATHNGYVSNNATITYGWESSFDNVTWSPVLSAQASSLTFLPFGVVVYYRRVGISNVATATCRDVSNIVVITPQEQIIQNNQKVCENEAFLELTVPNQSTTIQSYQWRLPGMAV